MMGARAQFADLSKLYTHKLVAERGLDTLQECASKKQPLLDEGRGVLTTVPNLLKGALAGGGVLEGGKLTPDTIQTTM